MVRVIFPDMLDFRFAAEHHRLHHSALQGKIEQVRSYRRLKAADGVLLSFQLEMKMQFLRKAKADRRLSDTLGVYALSEAYQRVR